MVAEMLIEFFSILQSRGGGGWEEAQIDNTMSSQK